MTSFFEYKNEVIKLLDEGMTFAEKAGYKEEAENINKNRERLNKNELVILVCGEIKRGKSSLLSGLLEEKDLFPIDVNVATNIVTIARYGEKEKIEIVFENNDQYETKEITRGEIHQYATEQGNKGNIKRIKCLHIQTPNPKLKKGLAFVDTPGVGSINLEHSEITYGYLPNADIVLFVSDTLSPLTESELKFLQTATGFCDNFIFPLTKIDKATNYEEIYESNLQKIQQYTSIPKEEIQILPVSSLAKIKYLETKNPMFLKSSKYQALENAIWTTVNNKRAQILFAPPLTNLAKELLTIKNSLNNQYSSLTQNTEASKELELHLSKLREGRQKLLEEGAEWKGQLQYELSQVFDGSVEEIQNKQLDIQEILNEVFKNDGILKDLEGLTATVNEELSILTYHCRKMILERVTGIVGTTEEKLGLILTINNDMVGKIDFDKNTTLPLELEKRGSLDKSIMVGRNMMMSGAGGGAIGTIAGGVIGGALGLLLGGPGGAIAFAYYGGAIGGGLGSTVGSGKGMLEGIKQVKNANVPQVRNAYHHYVNQNIVNIRNIILKTKSDITYEIINDLNNKIKAQRNVLEKDMKDIQENLTLSKTEAAQKANRIKNLFTTLNNIEVKLNNMMESIKDKGPAKRNPEERKENKRQEPQKEALENADHFAFLEV